MDARLPLDDLGTALGEAATVLRANAVAAGLDAPVPTCPGWTVARLVAHVGMAHRWAAGHVTGAEIDSPEAMEAAALSQPDLLGWFDDGATALLQAIVDAPEDLRAFVFLKNAPPPKVFWTRRQCHETTIHAVDALAARLGRAPHRSETWIGPALALDGIDELLNGFVPRRSQGIHPPEETVVVVSPDGCPVSWRLRMGPDHPVDVTVLDGASPAAYGTIDRSLTGHPVDLYLQLWNRSAQLDPWWHDLVTITWK
ncbi:maleylpyruvate isomerase family mycothiol-dependent enzyme [Intrasporangium sp. DVR]|uniref:maleylpyruvate isomerase family mycothiol-dependent enzyme n=1 Tax=Intrasporangium sp. DVR TaxID=3127867 RepID=UPI00313A5EF3